MTLQYGAALPITEIKAAGDAWEVEGYASTYGNLDLVGDVVLKGAFDESLRSGRKVRFLRSHRDEMMLGVPVELRSDDKGLWGKFRISKTQLGSETHELLKDAALDSFSIGYIPTELEYDDMGNRLLKSIELLEVSVVSIPANPEALVTGVKAVWDASYVSNLPDSAFAVILPGGEKDADGRTTPRSLRKLPHHKADGSLDEAHLNNALSREPQTDMSDALHAKAKAHLSKHKGSKDIGELLDTDVPFEDLFGQLKGWLIYGTDEAEALLQRRAEDERKLSDAHVTAIRDLLDTAKAQSERLEAVIAGPPPEIKAEPAINLRLERARLRLRSLGIPTEKSA